MGALGLADLADDAVLFARTVSPALEAHEWAALASGIEQACERLRAQGRLRRHGHELIAAGHGLLIAWEEDAALSGCSRDLLARALASCPGGPGRILEAPPLLVETAQGPRTLARAGVRDLIREGHLCAGSPWYDLRAATLGDWRHHGRVRLDASGLGQRLLADVERS